MFSIFKKQRGISAAHTGWVKLGWRLQHGQRKFANWLNKKAALLSAAQLTAIILFVCAGFAIASVYFLIQSIQP
jgi:hypothetical protein